MTHTADFQFHLSQNQFSQFSSSDHFALIKSTQKKLVVLTTLNFQKIKGDLGDLFGSKNPTTGNPTFLLKSNFRAVISEEKSDKLYNLIQTNIKHYSIIY